MLKLGVRIQLPPLISEDIHDLVQIQKTSDEVLGAPNTSKFWILNIRRIFLISSLEIGGLSSDLDFEDFFFFGVILLNIHSPSNSMSAFGHAMYLRCRRSGISVDNNTFSSSSFKNAFILVRDLSFFNSFRMLSGAKCCFQKK